MTRTMGCKCRRIRLTALAVTIPMAILVTLCFVFHNNNSRSMMIALRQQQQMYTSEFEDRKGVQVIVGHYIGNGLIGNSAPELTPEELNTNGYDPKPGAGEMGEPVQMSPLETGNIRKFYHINKFNLMVSDRISVNRSLPDARNPECQKVEYDLEKLSTTSVIIVFHNEAWSTLLRTVHSVINRSPHELLKEIILVDDNSDRRFLLEGLDEYVSKLFIPIIVLRTKRRVGLIKARIQGANIAKGTTLTFLDAHCECTPGWLQPLLARIAQNSTHVVCPIIDIINDDTFAYVRSFEMHWGAINWDLHYRWFPISSSTMKARNAAIMKPFMSPVMAGGLYSIDKAYFKELGMYDKEMDIWGGENIELSFKIWQCGGTVEIVPCSHVGHVFRKASPYTFPRPGGIATVLFKNLARVAEVWMDEWKEFFFTLHPEAQSIRHKINVTDRLLIRQKLGCKSFRWYLDNIWLDHFFPTDDAFIGRFQNKDSEECLRRPRSNNGANQATGNAITASCSSYGMIAPLLFILTPSGYVMSDESVCLDVPDPDMTEPTAFFLACTRLSGQRWRYNSENELLMHEETGLCLDLPSESKRSKELILKECSSKMSQRWTFWPFSWRTQL